MAFVIQNNTPSLGYISWTGLNINYLGTNYALPDGNTNKIYTYWLFSQPTVLQTSDTFPSNLNNDDLLLFLNKNGVATVVPGASILPGDLIVPGTVLGKALA